MRIRPLRSFSRRLAPGDGLRRMLGNSAWLLGARLAAIPVGVLQTVLSARLLGVESYGVLAIIVTLVSMLNQLTSFRMNEFVVKHVSDATAADRRDVAAAVIKVALLTEAAASALSFALVWAAAGLAAERFVGQPSAELIRICSFMVLGNLVFESATGIFQIFDRFRAQAAIALAIKVLTLAGVAASWLAGGGLREVVLAFTIGNALPALAASVLALREVGRRLGDGWWRTSLGVLAGQGIRLSAFAVSTNASSTLSLIVKDADALWIGWLSSPTEVGYYRVATTLVKLVLLPGNPLAQAVYPEIVRALSRGEIERTRALIQRATLLAAAWILPLAVLLTAAGPWLIPAFYGSDFQPAAAILAVLMVGMGVSQALFWNRPTILALGQPGFALKLTVVSALLKVPLALLLVPPFGALAMAGLTSGLFVLGGAGSTWFVHRRLRAASADDVTGAATRTPLVELEPLGSEVE